MITDAVSDRVLKSGHQPFHTPDLFLVSLNGEMFLKESDVGIIPRQTDPDGTVFQIGILQKPVRSVLVAVGPDGNDQCQDQYRSCRYHRLGCAFQTVGHQFVYRFLFQQDHSLIQPSYRFLYNLAVLSQAVPCLFHFLGKRFGRQRPAFRQTDNMAEGISFIHQRKVRFLVSNCMAFPSLLLGNWHLFFRWICSR